MASSWTLSSLWSMWTSLPLCPPVPSTLFLVPLTPVCPFSSLCHPSQPLPFLPTIHKASLFSSHGLPSLLIILRNTKSISRNKRQEQNLLLTNRKILGRPLWFYNCANQVQATCIISSLDQASKLQKSHRTFSESQSPFYAASSVALQETVTTSDSFPIGNTFLSNYFQGSTENKKKGQ